MLTMPDSKTPGPPPLPPTLPLRLVREVDPELLHLRRENRRLVAENFTVAAERDNERNLVELLRQQLRHATDGKPDEPTAPGIGPLLVQPRVSHPAPPEPARGAMRASNWVLIGTLALGLAADLASLRYPGLVGPIRAIAKTLPELLSLLGLQ